MKRIFFAGLLWAGMVGGQMAQAAPEDEPTNVIEDALVFVGDFKMCSVHYMTHLYSAGEVDVGLFEVIKYGYYFNGRCVSHVLPREFNSPRVFVIGADGRGNLASAGNFDTAGRRLTPYADEDPQPVTRFGTVSIGKRILRLKLIRDAAVYGGYRFSGLVYIP